MTFHASHNRAFLAAAALLLVALLTPAAHAQFESKQFISEAWFDIYYGPGATLQQLLLRPLHKCADLPTTATGEAGSEANASHLDVPVKQVNIEARFLLVNDRFAKDLGFDWNLGGEDNYGTFFGGHAGDALIAGARAAGLTRDNAVKQNEGTDLEPRISNLFPRGDNYTPVPVNFIRATFLDDLEVDLLIRAAASTERTNTLTAPRVTMFNGQAATIQSTPQQAFVTSLAPIVGAGGTGFDPNVNVTPEGVVLNVRPVVSADRRYVTLTLQPTVATLLQPITPQVGEGGNTADAIGTVCVTNIAGPQIGFVPVLGQAFAGNNPAAAALAASANIQLPQLSTTQVQTTVSVPDGGTVLLGGVKTLREDRDTAGVPILNKIPYISRLFRNVGVGRDTNTLMIFVTPRITIQEEEGDNHAKTVAHARTPKRRTKAFAISDARRLLRDAERAQQLHESNPDAGFDDVAVALRAIAADPADPNVRLLLQDDAFILSLAGVNATFGLTVPGGTRAGLTEADLNQPAKIPADALIPAAAHVSDVVNAVVPGVE